MSYTPEYNPQNNLLAGLRAMERDQLFPYDEYFMTMADADFQLGRADLPAAKSFFMRIAPFNGAFALMGGITAALRGIADMRLDNAGFQKGLEDMGYGREFRKFLAKRKKLRVKVYAPREGDLIFPNEPVITVVGGLLDCRLAEGIITEAVNFNTLSLTKWNRFVRVARPGQGLDFSRRRAQNAARSSLNAMLAGCTSTSNVDIRSFFDVRVTGTMGHEWMQSFGDVRVAFEAWLSKKPGKPIGLVDTKQCMAHDFPAWLDTVYKYREEIKAANPIIWGWRNDSGDLTYLTLAQYVYFLKHKLAQDPWFVERMRIINTGDLDEYEVYRMTQEIYVQARNAGLDAEDIMRRVIWAAGTRPGTCEDQPSLGGVAKLMSVETYSCIKLAFDKDGRPGMKTSIPGFNRSAIIRSNGEVKDVLIYPAGFYEVRPEGSLYDLRLNKAITELIACHPDNPGARMIISNYHATAQQKEVYDTDQGGFTTEWDDPTIQVVPKRIQENVDSLDWTMSRLKDPYPVKVSLTPDLFELRMKMLVQGVLREDFLQDDAA